MLLGAGDFVGLLAEAGGELIEVAARLLVVGNTFGEALFKLGKVGVELGFDLVELLLLRGNDLERFCAALGERCGELLVPRLFACHLRSAGR